MSASKISKGNYIIQGCEPIAPLSDFSLGKQLLDDLIKNKDVSMAFIDVITREKRSYNEILQKSCQLADALKKFGLKQDDVVAIFSGNNLDYFYPVLAALYLGVIVATFNPTYVARELIHAVTLSKPKIIFCTVATVKTMLQISKSLKHPVKIVLLDTKEKSEDQTPLDTFISTYSNNFDVTEFKPTIVHPIQQTAFILYSSGTTGLPKGVMLSHRNVAVIIANRCNPNFYRQLPPETGVFLSVLPFYHAYGLFSTLHSFTRAVLIAVMRKFDENLLLKTIQDYKITSLTLVPPLVVILNKSELIDRYDLSSLKEVTCGAAPLSKDQEESATKRLKLQAIEQGYGMTETTLAVLKMPINKCKRGSCGKVLPFAAAKVIDLESGEPLGPYQRGELCFKGEMIMKGYVEDIEATKRTITDDGWLLTGDIGYYDEDGFFYVVDRLKELIKYKGFQVPPAELEAILLTHPKIKDAGVIGIPDDVAGELPFAFVVLQPNQSLTDVEVQNFVARQVSSQKKLRGGVRFLNEIPKNPSGKILRRKLREFVAKQKSKL